MPMGSPFDKQPINEAPKDQRAEMPQEKKVDAERDDHFLDEIIGEETLREVFYKCTKEKSGKYDQPLFLINVFLDGQEIQKIDTLINVAETRLDIYKNRDPHWRKFTDILDEQREKLGTFGESSNIVVEENIGEPQKSKNVNDVPIIKVTQDVKNIYTYESLITSLRNGIKRYSNQTAKGTVAKGFGRDVHELFKFVEASEKDFK